VSELAVLAEPVAALGSSQRFLIRARRSRTFIVGCAITALMVLVALLAPVLSPYGPTTQNYADTLAGFSSAHWLGTDQLGRDVLSRLFYGARSDLTVGFVAVIFPLVFGSLLGLICGYRRGRLDTVVVRVIEVVLAFPFYVLVIALVFVFGAGTKGIYVAVGLVDWVVYARIVRSATLTVRELDFVLAARAGGIGERRVIFVHVLPNVISQAVVYVMSDIVLVIVAVVTLGYLGYGVQPPTADWGIMISDGQQFLTTRWELATIPGLCVVLTGIGLSLLGDGLADIMRAP
jgi:peptide/nickel transport system permease protein